MPPQPALPRALRGAISLAGFLLGLVGVIRWQQAQDRALLAQMPLAVPPPDPSTDPRGE